MSGRIRQWIGYIIAVIGLFVLASPFITGYIDGNRQKQVVQEFLAEMPLEEEISDGETAKDTETEKDTVEENVEEQAEEQNSQINREGFYQAAKSYNEQLYATHQDKLVSTAATERFSLDASRYGYSGNMIGTLWVPRMNIELGLYLGANSANMAQGAAIFGETSIPLGLPNENTSIAGHRGWCGTPMFRDIQAMQLNDKIYITTTWGVLVYNVCNIIIVTPEDNEWCHIQEGRSLIALMTCHPYTQHYQRYVVFGEYVETLPGNALTLDEELRQKILKETEETLDPSPKLIVEYHEDGTTSEVTIDPSSIDPDGSEYGSVWSNVMILAEKQIFIITIVLAGVVVLLGIWLVRGTARDIREWAREGE